MTEIECPFCGNVHDTEVMDLTAHYAPYLQALLPAEAQPRQVNPDSVMRAMRALEHNTQNPRFRVKRTHLTDGWTGD